LNQLFNFISNNYFNIE